MSLSCNHLIQILFESERAENENLMNILGLHKPQKGSSSTLTVIIRGFITKNSKLLSLITNSLEQMASNPEYEKGIFKSFINDFILWFESNTIVLIKKYLTQLDQLKIRNPIFHQPVLNCSNYINFMAAATQLIRNPFIIERLNTMQREFEQVLLCFSQSQQKAHLDNISFDKVQQIGTPSMRQVSSFFNSNQITYRSENEQIFLRSMDSHEQVEVELVCLNLNLSEDDKFDALALLSKVGNSQGELSLMYPPFRVNEFSIRYNSNVNEIKLSMLDYAANSTSRSITIWSKDSLNDWYQKLLQIFPRDNENPVLIESRKTPSFKSSGLGINVLQGISSESDNDSEFEKEFKELIDSPTIPSVNSVRKELLIDAKESLKPPEVLIRVSDSKELESPVSMLSNMSSSNVSETNKSSASDDSQYEQLVSKMRKSLTMDSQICSITRNVVSNKVDHEQDEERPVSYSAEILDSSPCNVAVQHTDDPAQVKTPKRKAPFSQTNYTTSHVSKSVPNLNDDDSPSNAKSFFLQNASSSIDLSNFGKNHQPSFSIHKDLCNLINEPPVEKKKSSIFGLFKKKNSKNSTKASKNVTSSIATPATKESNLEQQTIETPKSNTKTSSSVAVTTDDRKPSNKSREFDSQEKKNLQSDFKPPKLTIDTTGAKNVNGPPTNGSSISLASKTPSAFALPSSTSMQFFNPNDMTENGVAIPNELKEIINDDSSIDFYISPSTPKAFKISKWKPKYGKWEMITASDNVFLKIVNNYRFEKSWLLVFKEERINDTDLDIPMLILELQPGKTKSYCSSSLDYVLTSENAVTKEMMDIMIRFNKMKLLKTVSHNVDNVLGALSEQSPMKLKSFTSSSTITSSIMDTSTIQYSSFSSLASVGRSPANSCGPDKRSLLSPQQNFPKPSRSLYAINNSDMDPSNIINNPNSSKLLLLNKMKIRLQRNLEGYSQIHNPSSWEILSMNNISVYMIHDHTTDTDYYNLVVEGNDNYSWLIDSEDKFNVIERIGKAGMIIKLSEDQIYMIECKGKKELKTLFEVF